MFYSVWESRHQTGNDADCNARIVVAQTCAITTASQMLHDDNSTDRFTWAGCSLWRGCYLGANLQPHPQGAGLETTAVLE